MKPKLRTTSALMKDWCGRSATEDGSATGHHVQQTRSWLARRCPWGSDPRRWPRAPYLQGDCSHGRAKHRRKQEQQRTRFTSMTEQKNLRERLARLSILRTGMIHVTLALSVLQSLLHLPSRQARVKQALKALTFRSRGAERPYITRRAPGKAGSRIQVSRARIPRPRHSPPFPPMHTLNRTEEKSL